MEKTPSVWQLGSFFAVFLHFSDNIHPVHAHPKTKGEDGMGRKVFPVFLLLMALLSGCDREVVPPQVRVVTRVDVVCNGERGEEMLRRQYIQQEKMHAVLNYLRLLDCRDMWDIDPERVQGNAYQITVHFSEGVPNVYYQRCERFLSKNRRPWEKIDSEQVGPLYPILRDIPTDM